MTGKTYRLLSEAEWEYAARAGTTTAYPWGDEVGNRNASCYQCGGQWNGTQTAPVGSFAANPFGLHDMNGNVSEWVEDCTHDSFEGAPDDGSAWMTNGNCKRHITRGGSWFEDPDNIRSAYRDWYATDYRLANPGFRVARTLDQ